MIYEGTITFRFRAPSQQVAELYIDGLCTALRYNKPEIASKSVRWDLNEVSDDLQRTEFQIDEPRDAEGLPDAGHQLPPGDEQTN